ncbi:MAG: penicillin-binding protein 2, partial [Deferribacterota bacterium]|nr:penicillin-binding protein 2 [Deferribacterota bacterium]
MLNNREFKVYIFVVLVFIISFIIIIRLIYLQILKHDYYYALSEKQSNKFVEITNNRGIIYDRNGQIVADNKATASLFIYGDKIESPEKFIDILSKSKIEINKSKINSIINKEGFRWIKRGVDILDAYNLKEQYPRVDLVKHDLRFYPNKSSLADIIGFTGIDNQGLYGIEYNLDRILKLQKTKLSFLRDSRGKIIDLSSINKREAKEVYLTIDLKMQRIAEIILGGDMKEFKATGALAAAMDVNTGEILFSAHLPSFDPNKYYKYSRNLWKNNLTQFLFEPGSIFKPVIFSFLVDNGLINEHERIDCENGSYRISGNIFNDVESHGSLNIYDVVVESSNIGMVKLAKRIQPIKLYNYLKLCGFGEKTGIYGLNEESGLVRDLNRWSNLSKYSISIGQEILVTPIQI